eukprot:UN07171
MSTGTTNIFSWLVSLLRLGLWKHALDGFWIINFLVSSNINFQMVFQNLLIHT